MADALGSADRIHIVGIGGAGMSALARLLAGRGHSVTGSDAKDSPTLVALSSEGIRCWAGHRPAEVDGVDLLVASSAVVDDDPELNAAVAGGVEVWRRPELLAAVTGSVPTIGATGTHGKTSTSAMLVRGAVAAGLDPSFVVGGDLVDLGTNAMARSGELLILEVDEAFGTFEHVSLEGLVVTNVEADHLDHFGTIDELHAAFERVARKVNGPVLACVDDPGSRRLVDVAGAIGYGLSSDAFWGVRDLLEGPDGSEFRLVGPDVDVVVGIPRPGLHMATNAAGALALLSYMGVDLAAAAVGLGQFKGVARRWEEKGTAGGVTVIDDYAHHPTEVAATLDAALRSGRRVVAVFQPHLYSRTALNAEGFGEALAKAHAAVVLDVYGAREDPVPGVDGYLVSKAVRDAGGAVVADAPVRAEAAAVVMSLIEQGDLVVCMGAGDISELSSELVTLLEAGN